MQLYDQTLLASQAAYARNLSDLATMQDSIDAMEKLIDDLNQLAGIQAQACFNHYREGMPGLIAQISAADQIEVIADLITSHGWARPKPHPTIETTEQHQTWMAYSEPFNPQIKRGFAIDFTIEATQ